MGTLTADVPRLDEHCPHKLPTSCRLTSTPNCCACADRRQHFSTYSVYIDGIGFVPRGTRWQSYCWFCKEFWDNRLAAVDPPMRTTETKIPEIPDQSEFLERWFEFHQGYRVVKQDDGAETRIAVLGEPFMDVSPGCLPRTLEELRNGLQAALSCRRESQSTSQRPERESREPQQSLDDALDDLLAEAEEEEEASASEQQDHPLTDLPIETRRRLTLILSAANALQSQIGQFLNRFHDTSRRDSPTLGSLDSLVGTSRSLLSDTTTIEQQVNDLPRLTSQNSDYTFRSLDSLVDELTSSLTAAKTSVETANGALTALSARHRLITTNLETAHGSVRSVREYLARTTRQLRTAENFARVFGSREDVMRDDYESPLGAMFSRAHGRYVAAEEARRRLQRGETLRPLPNDPLAALWGVPVPLEQQPPGAGGTIPAAPPGDAELAMQLLQPMQVALQREQELDRAEDEAAERPLGLDADDARPAPLEDEQLQVKLACRICFTQRSSVALLPCGHLVMCQWCANQAVPGKGPEGALLRRDATCPLCRKRAKRRVDIYVG